jgi:hypothetical protein
MIIDPPQRAGKRVNGAHTRDHPRYAYPNYARV